MLKFKNIEFLRVVACFTIVLFHLCNSTILSGIFSDLEIYQHLERMTCNGQKAVDLFFILSGLFFGLKINTNISCWEFIRHKLIRFYPVMLFVLFLYLCLCILGLGKFTFYDNILNLLFLNGTGLVLNHGNAGHFWYISALFWTTLGFFYIHKYFDKKYVNIIIALLVYFVYSFIIHAKGGQINSHTQTFCYVLNIGMLRAIGGIGIGYFIGEWWKNNSEKIKKWQVSLPQTILFSITEFVCLYFIINNLMLHNLKYKNQFIFIVVFTITVCLFLAKKGLFTKLLNKDIWVKLSKYTFAMYMVHIPILHCLKRTLWKHNTDFVYAHPIWNIILVLAIVILLTLFIYHFVEKPATKYLSQKYEKS